MTTTPTPGTNKATERTQTFNEFWEKESDHYEACGHSEDFARIVWNAALAASAPLPAAPAPTEARPLQEKADRWNEWHAMCRRVDTELPEGWLITYDMGPGMWGISLYNPDGDVVDFCTDDCDTDAEMILCALDQSKHIESSSQAPKQEGSQT